ncbi:hypothetical protein DYB32_009701 [Aphanomyces invadans]|uniref:TLC domain-containing protein n=1 Tax=Aphanomyces invadans TaxID=157072 RepID=A0A3R6V4M3_9STRA|nr:hypothetical protein DYB32_009701 [Aphanomyces invadans]
MLTWEQLTSFASVGASVGLFHGIRYGCLTRLQAAIDRHGSPDRTTHLMKTKAPLDVATIVAQCVCSTIGLVHFRPLLPALAEYVADPQHISFNYGSNEHHVLFTSTLLVVGGYIWSLLFAPKSAVSIIHHVLLLGLIVAATSFNVAVEVAAVYTVSTFLTMQPVLIADALFRAKSSWASPLLRTALVYYGIVKAVAAFVLWGILNAQTTTQFIAQGMIVWTLSTIHIINFLRMIDHYNVARTWLPIDCATSDSIIAAALGFAKTKSLKA